MSIFASQTTETIPIPFDVPHTITIRKLTGWELERAQSEHLRGTIDGYRGGRGWAAAFQRRLAKGTATEHDVNQALADPLNGYDRLTIVQAGITAWSYLLEAKQPKPVNAAAIADLDDEAMEFLAVAIMKLTKPALFATQVESEEARKNG